MLKQFLEKMRLWEEAFSGMDDLQGEYQAGLEKRLARLETAVAELRNMTPSGTSRNASGELDRGPVGRASSLD